MVSLNPLDPFNKRLNQQADKPREGFFGKIGKLATGIFSGKPKGSGSDVEKMVPLQSSKEMQAAVSHVLPAKAKQVMNIIGVTDLGMVGDLTIQESKNLIENPEVKAYLKDGTDLPTLQILTAIACRAHSKEWASVNQSEEIKGLSSQVKGKTGLFEADILRASSFVLDGQELSKEERVAKLKEFAGDESTAEKLSHAVQQGLASTINMKVSTVFMESNILTGSTEIASGGLQEISIGREGDAQLVLGMTVRFPLSRIPTMQHIMNLDADVEVRIAEDDFKKGDYSKAQFTCSTRSYAPESNDLDDFHLV